MHQISFHIYSVSLTLIYFSGFVVAEIVSQSLVIVVSVYSFQIWPFQTALLKNKKLKWCSFSTVLAAPILSVSSPSCDSIAVSWILCVPHEIRWFGQNAEGEYHQYVLDIYKSRSRNSIYYQGICLECQWDTWR